jgi:glycosyltransferase involved in cell wall biosynthesis
VFSEVTAAGERELPPAQRALQRCLASRVAGFVAASTAARRRLEALGVPPERIEVSLQSADVEAFRAVSHESRFDPQAAQSAGPVRVLAVGRLVPDKNLELLIAAFADAGLPEAAELHLCGSGPLEGELRALASRRGVPVRFRGYVPPEELPHVYAKADLLALVSAYEPFGAAVREAVAAGLPLLCARTAGAAGELALEGENALLVDPGDRAEVSAALARLVRDGALRSRMAAASRAISTRHPLEADAEAFERAVLGALSSYRAGRAAPPGEASR